MSGSDEARQVGPEREITFLVIEHEDLCPPAWLGQWWQERGVRLRRVRAHTLAQAPRHGIPRSTGDADALVVLGGEPSATDDERCPWLAPTRDLIAATVAAGVPFLGVCLGHQLASVALGGRVGRNPSGQTVGLTPVTLTARGGTDPLFGAFDGAEAIHWNSDIALDLPADAVVLASAPDGSPQVVRYAPWAYGVQFHPECTPDQFASWAAESAAAGRPAEGEQTQRRAEAATAAIRAAEAELVATWRPLAANFLDLVRDFRPGGPAHP